MLLFLDPITLVDENKQHSRKAEPSFVFLNVILLFKGNNLLGLSHLIKLGYMNF